MSDLDIDRERYRREGVTPSPRALAPPGTTAVVGNVRVATTLPTAGGLFYTMSPVAVLGSEVEGGAGTIAINTTTTFQAVVYGTPPALGDNLICRFVDNRWVADRYGKQAAPVVTYGCGLCTTIPATLTMTVTNPTLNNSIFQSCTLQYYSSIPSALSAFIAPGIPVIVSTATFTDTVTPFPFYYYFFCFQGAYRLTRLYPTTVTGTPFRDGIRYSWTPGSGGNTCSPFSMTSGVIFVGGNASTTVAVTA